MSQKWFKAIGLFLVVFTLLFLGRWWCLYSESKKIQVEVPVPAYQPSVSDPQVEVPAAKRGDDDSNDTTENYEFKSIAFHNYAKEKKEGSSEQIYEKVTTLAARTQDFDSDEQKVRDTIQANQVLVQQEEKNGLKGGRLLTLTLGVTPDHLDSLVADLKKAGELVSFQTTKTDKTHDYLSLLAQRASLEKDRADLTALKSAAGKMADSLNLQEKIFNLGKEIEDLGIEISQFEGATGFCTVLLNLKEIGPGPSPWVLAAGAFEWTLDFCLYYSIWAFAISIIFLFLAWLIAIAKPQPLPGKAKAAATGRGASFREFFSVPNVKIRRNR